MFTEKKSFILCRVSFIMKGLLQRDVIVNCIKLKVISALLLHHVWLVTLEA